MEFMESMSYDNEVCFGLGDWCPPEGAEICPTVITDTSYFYIDNKIMARCASLLGKDGSNYKKRAREIKEAFHKKHIGNDFYLSDNITAIACTIYQDLYNDEEKKLAAKRLDELCRKNGFHISCGILGIKYLYSALSDYGYADTAFKLTVNPQYPSYAYWILNGMTTLCENWDMSHSCNHHMYSEVDMWLYKYVAGIHIDEGGGSVHVKPCFIDDIEFVRASYRGITVSYDKEKIEIISDIPAIYVNSSGEEVYLGEGVNLLKI